MARAGRAVRQRAWQRRSESLVTNRALLLQMTLGYAVLMSFAYALLWISQPSAALPYIVGGMVVGYFWFMASILNAIDGTFSTWMAATAEGWTSDACGR